MISLAFSGNMITVDRNATIGDERVIGRWTNLSLGLKYSIITHPHCFWQVVVASYVYCRTTKFSGHRVLAKAYRPSLSKPSYFKNMIKSRHPNH